MDIYQMNLIFGVQSYVNTPNEWTIGQQKVKM